MYLNILWLVPVAYLIHICEETPRFVPWAKRYLLSTMTFPEFVMGNVIFMAYVLISVFLATFYTTEWTLILGLSTAAWIFSNFTIHAYYTLSTGEYSPGVVTAGAVYVPVSLYIFANFVGSGVLTNVDIILSIIIGAFAVMYLPTLIQQRRDKIRKENTNQYN
jgi:hypothetical protein